ncbi:MAG: hypothetical protein WBO34_06895 [Gammaproteobacteria bacterium]
MVDVALELAPELEEARKLQHYVTAKLSMLEEADETDATAPMAVPRDSMHGAIPEGTKAPHADP